MDNSADFGLTQLPVDEKRLQVVSIYRDEIRLIVPAGHPLANRAVGDRPGRDGLLPACCPSTARRARASTSGWKLVEEDIRISMELDSTEMMKRFVMAGLGVSFVAVSNCREEIAGRKTAGHPAGAGTHGPPPGTDLPQGQSLIQGGLGIHPGCAG